MMTRIQEAAHKTGLVRSMLAEKGLPGVIIQKQANFSWLTAGGRGFIGLAGEVACASLVVTADGVYLAGNNIETPRLLAEELPVGFAEPVAVEWTQDGAISDVLRQRFGALADDQTLDSWFRETRVKLLPTEVERYAKAGETTARILEDVCREIKPGATELEIAGTISGKLWSAGIEPITMLVAADDRSNRFRHYVPTEASVSRGVICSLCSRAGGLVVSATRVVAFADDFAQRYDALLQVEHAAFEATQPDVALGETLKRIMVAYDENGLEGEWRNHHQGGMTGYLAREVRADLATTRAATVNQAFAWNPSAVGAKCEDTVLLTEGGMRVLTPSAPGWPTVEVGGLTRPAVLRR